MFTLKLYRNGPLPPDGRAVIMEVAGVWVTHCSGDIKRIQTFKKKVGVMDEDGGFDCYVGGTPTEEHTAINSDNHFGWAVLENAQGKTTEMFR
jgi:hypothetical protein